jgi:iron complex outermembrane receptor protein
MVSPEEISRIDVMYGPFSAAFAGNSIGSVVEITTRMPDELEGSFNAIGSLQDFRQYATDDTYGAHQFSGTIGDRFGDLAFWLGASFTDSNNQPLTYVTANRPASPSGVGTVLSGAFDTRNRAGAPIVVIGAGGLEHQKQDNVKLKLSWDIAPDTTIAYSVGRFGNDTESRVESYLRNGLGATVYAGGPFNINGYSYANIAASAFSNNAYTFNETQWMQSLVANHEGSGVFDWRLAASVYDYDESVQRIPSVALPGASTGGAGSITRFDGTGWANIDLKGIWRPDGKYGAHEVSFGYHFDQYELENHRYNTTDWRSGSEGALASAAEGKTRTTAVWVQDAWQLGPQLLLTTGLRAEDWKAYDGLNYSLSPSLNVHQPELNSSKVSPKASLQIDMAPGWIAQASYGRAYRFPTVAELYQSITTGATLTVPNPNLRPEDAMSTELTVRHEFDKGDVRVSVFTENIRDALISQSAPLVPASPTLFNYVQNVDKVRSRGVEVVATRGDLFVSGLSVTGSMTFVDSQIVADAAFPAAIGKRTPQVPQWRSTIVATYRPDDQWTFTLAGRYSDRVFATIDNSDPVTHTYQGFDSYLVFDARVNYDIDDHWRAAIGFENFGNENYILFHSFPQRTATAELQYHF